MGNVETEHTYYYARNNSSVIFTCVYLHCHHARQWHMWKHVQCHWNKPTRFSMPYLIPNGYCPISDQLEHNCRKPSIWTQKLCWLLFYFKQLVSVSGLWVHMLSHTITQANPYIQVRNDILISVVTDVEVHNSLGKIEQ